MKDAVLIMLACFGIALAFPTMAMLSIMLWKEVRDLWKEAHDEKTN